MNEDVPCRICTRPALSIWHLPGGCTAELDGTMVAFGDPVQALCGEHVGSVIMPKDNRRLLLLNGVVAALNAMVLDRPVALCPKCGGQAVKMGDQPMATAQCPKCDKFHAVPWRSTDNG